MLNAFLAVKQKENSTGRSEDAGERQERSTHPDRTRNALRRVPAQLLAADRGGGGNADGRRAHADPHHERGLGLVPRRSGRARAHRAILPAPWYRSVLRPGRGWRPALPLSWVALRPARAVSRSAGGAVDAEILRPAQAPCLSG